MVIINMQQINKYVEYLSTNRPQSIITSVMSDSSQNRPQRPKSVPPRNKIFNNRNINDINDDVTSDDSDMNTTSSKPNSKKKNRQIKNKDKKIKLLDAANIFDPEDREELMLLSLSTLKMMCKDKIKHQQEIQTKKKKKNKAKKHQSSLRIPKYSLSQRTHNTQLDVPSFINTPSNTHISDDQIENFMEDEDENKQNDKVEGDTMSIDSMRSHNLSHRSSKSNRSPRIDDIGQNELPQRVKKERFSKRKKKGNKINLNILNQAIKSEDVSAVTNLPHFPFDEELPSDVESDDFCTRYKPMTEMNRILHPLWQKSSLRYDYENGKSLTITWGSVKQLEALLKDKNDKKAYQLALRAMNMSDEQYGQLSKYGGFAVNNYRSGRVIICEEYYDSNNTTMSIFQLGHQLRNGIRIPELDNAKYILQDIHNMDIDMVVQNLFTVDPNVRSTVMHGHHPGAQFDQNELFGMISFTPNITMCINKSWKPLNRGYIDAQVNFKNSENPVVDVITLSNGPHYFIFNGFREKVFIKTPKLVNMSSDLNIASFGKAISFNIIKERNKSIINRIKQSKAERRSKTTRTTSSIQSIIKSTSETSLRFRGNRPPNNNFLRNRYNNNYSNPRDVAQFNSYPPMNTNFNTRNEHQFNSQKNDPNDDDFF